MCGGRVLRPELCHCHRGGGTVILLLGAGARYGGLLSRNCLCRRHPLAAEALARLQPHLMTHRLRRRLLLLKCLLAHILDISTPVNRTSHYSHEPEDLHQSGEMFRQGNSSGFPWPGHSFTSTLRLVPTQHYSAGTKPASIFRRRSPTDGRAALNGNSRIPTFKWYVVRRQSPGHAHLQPLGRSDAGEKGAVLGALFQPLLLLVYVALHPRQRRA